MRYEFDSFTFDTDARQLTSGGHDVHLSAKAIDLLRLLIERRPRVVKKQDLHDALWPDTFVVDSSLPVLVRELRKALGDSRHAIRTVHGFGYSFASDARESRRGTASPAIAPAHQLRYGDHVFLLHEGRNVIGRDPAADVCIASTAVSRQQAAITIDNERATIEDLGSKNGTRVDGVPIDTPTLLRAAATIRIGTVELLYSRISLNAETETVGE